jgi:hypothetical protein
MKLSAKLPMGRELTENAAADSAAIRQFLMGLEREIAE